MIMGVHAVTLTSQSVILEHSPLWVLKFSLVPMFFALSGFLITGSASRLNLGNFLINRSLRIVPALAVDTCVCALIIGPLFTHLSLGGYFSGHQFLSYFLNILGWVHYYLPGMFENHLNDKVNGSLWTVPFEICCYMLMSLFISIRWLTDRLSVLRLCIGYLVVSVAYQGLTQAIHWPDSALTRGLDVLFFDERTQTITAFLFGIAAYQNRARIPYSRLLFAVCLLALALAGLGMGAETGRLPLMRLVLLPCVTYAMIFIGLTPMPLPAALRSGDYSYGVYLYHQPFLQIAIDLVPPISPLGAFVASAPAVFGVAWLSWHFVEKPILARRRRFSLAAKSARH
jgi:peptidoglycan/LPS O-acetylase OafA/YrhL